MKIFLTTISIVWLLMNFGYRLLTLIKYLESGQIAELLGSLIAILLLTSPAIWYLWKTYKPQKISRDNRELDR